MKHSMQVGVGFCLSLLVAAGGARGASLTFDANTAAASAQDGSGNWTNGVPTTNWWNGLANTNWNNAAPDSATFGNNGAAGTVTLTGPISAGGITFGAVASGNYVIRSNTLTLVGTPVISAASNATINSIIAGSGFLKTGSATLTLGGANSYTGQTTLSQGIILANTSSALGSGALSITNAAVRLVVGNGVSLLNAITIGQNGGTVGNGLVHVNATSTGTISGPVTINNGASAGGHFASAAAATARLNVNGAITSSVAVVSRQGFVVFSGGGSYSAFTIGADTVWIGANNGLATGAVVNVAGSAAGTLDLRGFNQTLAGLTNNTFNATIQNSGATMSTLTLSGGGSHVYTGLLNGAIALVKTGPGAQLLRGGASTYTGGTTVAEGTLGILAANNLGTGPVAIQTAGMLLASPTAQQTITARISGDGQLSKTGAGNLVLQGSNSFSGNITVQGSLSAGAFVFDGINSAAGMPFVTNNGWITIATPYVGTDLVLGGLAGTGLVDTAFGATTGIRGLQVNQAGDSTYSGALNDSGGSRILSLTKAGAGTLTLSGVNTLSGGVKINGGTLALAGSGSIANSAISVGAGGVFDVTALANLPLVAGQTLQGFGTVIGQVVTDSGAGNSRLLAGGDGTPGTLTVTGDVIVGSTIYTNSFDLTNSLTVGGGVNDLLDITGTFEPNNSGVRVRALAPLSAGTYRLINYGSGLSTPFSGTLLGNTYRDTWTLDTATAGQVNLIVAAGTNYSLVWQPQLDGNWDTLVSTNWTNTLNGVLEAFADHDAVLFDDGGAAFPVVNLASALKPASVTVSGASNYTFTGAGGIGDSYSATRLTKDGAGTLTLGTANSFSGGTVVSNGAVVRASSGALGSGPVALSSGTLLDDQTGGTVGNVLTGSGELRKSAGAALSLTGVSAFNGSVVISNGVTLAVVSNGMLNAAPFVGGIQNDGLLLFNNSTQTLAGPVSGSGAVMLTGPAANSGALTLTSTNTFTGLTMVNAGVLRLASSNGPAIAANVLADNVLSPDIYTTADNQFAPGVVLMMTNNATDHVRFELLGTTQTLAGVHTIYTGQRGVVQHREAAPTNLLGSTNSLLILNGSGDYYFGGFFRDQNAGRLGLMKSGTGTQTLFGSQIIYTLPTLVDGGLLRLESVTGFGSAISNNATVELFSGNATNWQFAANRTFGGTGTYVKTGPGRVRLNNSTINGSGQFLIQSGIFGNDGNSCNWTGSTANLDVSAGAIFDLRADYVTINALTGAGIVSNGYGNGANIPEVLTLGVADGSGVFSGTLGDGPGNGSAEGNGTLALVKRGSGTQVIAGTNTYRGFTVISNGVLSLGASGSISNSMLIVIANGATFEVPATGSYGITNFQSLEGAGNVSGSMHTVSGARIVPGRAGSIGTLNFANDLTLGLNVTNTFDLGGTTNIGGAENDLINIAGTLTANTNLIVINPLAPLANGSYRLFNHGSLAGGFNSNILGNLTRRTWTLDEATPGQINLLVGGSSFSLKWNAQTSTNWDINIGVNWLDTVGLTNTVYLDDDHVLFDDSGAVTSTVGMVGTLKPGSVTVNSSSNYSITGGGKISGVASLTKDGSGVLTLGGVNNDFTGGVFISNGTIRVAGNGIIPTSNTVVIGAPGTMEYALSNLTITVTNVFTGTGRLLLTFSGTTAGNAYLIGTNTGFNGLVELDAANATANKLNGVGLNLGPSAAIKLNAGTTFFPNGSIAVPQPIQINGSGNTENRGAIRLGLSTLSGGLTLNGSATIGTEGGTNSGGIATGAAGHHSLTLGTGASTGTGLFSGGISNGIGVLELIVSNGTSTVLGTNTYTGGTRINGGTLIVRELSDGGPSGIANSGQLTFGGGTLRYDGPDAMTARSIANTGASTYTVTNGLVTVSLNGPISGGGALTKSGPGLLSMGGTNSYTGTTTLSLGNMIFAATSSNDIGAITINGGVVGSTLAVNGPVTATGSTVSVGGAAADRSVLVINSPVQVNRLYVGNNGTAAGVVIQNGASVTVAPNAGGTDILSLGLGTGGYGYYRMNAGTLTAGQIGIGGSTANATCVFDQMDGTTAATAGNGWLLMGWGAHSKGALNIFGGSMASPPSGNPFTLGYNNGTGISIVNVVGSNSVLNSSLSTSGYMEMMRSASSNGSFLTLISGGRLIAQRIQQANATVPAHLAFNGGILQAKAGTTVANYLQGLSGVFIQGGGATIDTTNSTISISQNLLAPPGSGVSGASVTSGGTGYLGAPVVLISGGGGTGATAIAQMDLTAGTLTNILVTSPGVNYGSTPTVTLFGGGSTNPAVPGTATLGANTSGGLTKLGSGSLLLNGSSTFTGDTTVNAGSLYGTGSVAGAVSVAAGANLGPVSGSSVTGTFTMANLLLTNNGASISASLRGTSATLRVTGNVTLAATTTVYLLQVGPMTTGSHVLVDYDGSLIGNFSDLVPFAIPNGGQGFLSNNLNNTSIDLVVTNTGAGLKWNGLVNADWQNIGPLNWKSALDDSPLIYNPGDFVTFDDTAASNFVVNIADPVLPTSVTFNNDSNDYTLAGSGSIGGGATVTKSGTGTVTLATSDSFTGGTIINAGTLKAANAAALGAAGRAITFNGGTLQLANDTTHNSLNATAVNSATVVLDRATAGAGITNTFGALTFSNSTTLSVRNGSNVGSGESVLNFTGGWIAQDKTNTYDTAASTILHLSGAPSAGGANRISVIKTGVGRLILSGSYAQWDAGSANIALNEGTLELRSVPGDTGDFRSVIVTNGATLALSQSAAFDFKSGLILNSDASVLSDRTTPGAGFTHALGSLQLTASRTLNIGAGASVTSGTAAVTFNTTTLGGTPTINITNNGPALVSATITGLVNGAGATLVKNGDGTLTLRPPSPNGYTGGTIVNGGVLQLAYSQTTLNFGSIIGTVTVNTGATIRSTVDKGFGFAAIATGGVQTVILNAGLLDHAGTGGHGAGQTIYMTAGEIRSNGGTNTTTGGSYRIGSGTNSTIYALSSASTSLITGRVAMDTQGRFDVEDGAAEIDLLVAATITDGIGAGSPPNGYIKTNAGTMAVTAPNIYSGVTFINGGRLLVNNSTGSGTGTNTINVGVGGTLGGTGSVAGTVLNDGSLAPGASIGFFTIGQNYTQSSTGSYNVELGGNGGVGGVDLDQTLVIGTATLGGALIVTTTNAFTPAYGDTFSILIANTIAGTFATTNLPALAPTNSWNVEYTANQIILSITNAPSAPTGYDAFSNSYVLVQGPEGDDDLDGYANLYEYVTGSNPTNGSSANALSAARTNGLFALNFLRDTNTMDATLIVEGSYATTNDTEWIGFATNIAGSWGSATNVIEGAGNPAAVTAFDVAPAATNRFLRLRITRP